MEKEDRYTMTLKALKMGLESWDKDLDRYLDSTLIPTYDPINDYLDNLPKWDGKGHVEEFAKRVPTNNADFVHNFHVWMLSMVAHWMGRTPKQANAIVPLFIGKQGCGKSSFCSIILPPELQEFYNDRIDFKNDTSMFMGLTNTAL
jgi:predicted P-loop ATPase